MKPIRKLWATLCGVCRCVIRKDDAVCPGCKTPITR